MLCLLLERTVSDLATNRKAFHDYEILESFEAGIILTGTEVKSLRAHGGNLQEGYVKISGNSAWLIGASIAPYSFGNVYNHEERRERKLLLHHRELLRLQEASSEKGLTIVPLAFYLKKGIIKLKIAIGKGKKKYDKRQALMKKETEREVRRAMQRDQ